MTVLLAIDPAGGPNVRWTDSRRPVTVPVTGGVLVYRRDGSASELRVGAEKTTVALHGAHGRAAARGAPGWVHWRDGTATTVLFSGFVTHALSRDDGAVEVSMAAPNRLSATQMIPASAAIRQLAEDTTFDTPPPPDLPEWT